MVRKSDKPDTTSKSKKTPKITKHDSESEDEASLNEQKRDRYDATALDIGEDVVEGDVEEVDGSDWEGDSEISEDDDIDVGDSDDNGGDVDDDCSYGASKKRGVKFNIDKEDDDDDDGADINVDENELKPELYVDPSEHRSVGHLTLYEKVRILGDRTAQLAQGAKPMIKGVEGMDPRTIAQLELEAKVIPMKIIRPLPNGKKEIWSLKDLTLKKKYIIYGFTDGVVDADKVRKIKSEHQKGGSITGYYHADYLNSKKQNDPTEQTTQSISKTKTKAKAKSKSKSKN